MSVSQAENGQDEADSFTLYVMLVPTQNQDGGNSTEEEPESPREGLAETASRYATSEALKTASCTLGFALFVGRQAMQATAEARIKEYNQTLVTLFMVAEAVLAARKNAAATSKRLVLVAQGIVRPRCDTSEDGSPTDSRKKAKLDPLSAPPEPEVVVASLAAAAAAEPAAPADAPADAPEPAAAAAAAASEPRPAVGSRALLMEMAAAATAQAEAEHRELQRPLTPCEVYDIARRNATVVALKKRMVLYRKLYQEITKEAPEQQEQFARNVAEILAEHYMTFYTLPKPFQLALVVLLCGYAMQHDVLDEAWVKENFVLPCEMADCLLEDGLVSKDDPNELTAQCMKLLRFAVSVNPLFAVGVAENAAEQPFGFSLLEDVGYRHVIGHATLDGYKDPVAIVNNDTQEQFLRGFAWGAAIVQEDPVLRQRLVECHSLIKCDPSDSAEKLRSALERAFQTGVCVQLEVFKKYHSNSWGVRVCQGQSVVPPDTFMGEYVGKLAVAASNSTGEVPQDKLYLSSVFDLKDENGEKQQLVIDAAEYGSVSRFFAHSTDPNLVACTVWDDSKHHPRIFFFTSRPVHPGEALTYNFLDNGGKYESDVTLHGEVMPSSSKQ